MKWQRRIRWTSIYPGEEVPGVSQLLSHLVSRPAAVVCVSPAASLLPPLGPPKSAGKSLLEDKEPLIQVKTRCPLVSRRPIFRFQVVRSLVKGKTLRFEQVPFDLITSSSSLSSVWSSLNVLIVSSSTVILLSLTCHYHSLGILNVP